MACAFTLSHLFQLQVELKQHLASQPAASYKQQQHRQHRQFSELADHMQVDEDQKPQIMAAALMQQHSDFLNGI